MLQADLKILGGKHQGKLIPLTTKKFLVGREQDCHLRPNSDMVSRHHCVFSIDNFAVRLRDLGSTNGTRVNGEAIRGEVILKSGDRIGIGKLELELAIRQASETPSQSAKPVAMGSSAEMEAIPSGTTMELPAFNPEPQFSGSETSYEMSLPSTSDTSPSLTTDTAIVNAAALATSAVPGYPQMMPPGYPQMMPAGYPGMPQYVPQPMVYPQGYPAGYGQPVYPNMQAYPVPMPGYPAQIPQQPVAETSQGGASAASTAAAAAASAAVAPVKLPPPESTGFKEAAPPAPAPAGAAGAPATQEKPSTSAADIIKQYMQKRTK